MIPIDDFPWVKEWSECSPTRMFELLRQQVAQDVRLRQGMREPLFEGEPKRFGYGFAITESRDTFTVLLDAQTTHEQVSFHRGEHGIQVKNTNGELQFEAVPSRNPEGKCVMKIGKNEFPLWYVRKMALENLFFGIF